MANSISHKRLGEDAHLRFDAIWALVEAVQSEAILEYMKSACTLMELSVCRFESLYTAIQDLYASDCNRHSTWDSAKSGRQVVSLLLLGKMSPTDAKRGAKRRKNKRGGGSSCSAVCNTSGGKAGVASALGCEGTAAPASVVGFLTPGSAGSGNIGSITGINDEVRVSHYWMSKQGRAAWSVINDTSDLGPRLMRGRQLAS